jgi:uncharacterized protein (DUF488 family)
MSSSILTIGHSTHSMDDFLALLRSQSVTAIADVRSAPYSRRRTEYNREPLKAALRDAGIAYVFLGRELGARPTDPTLYFDGRVQYDMLAETAAFQDGLTRVIDGLRHHRIAIMCAEKDPIQCHRGLLISPRLEVLGVGVSHILGHGGLETHAEAMTRLLALYDMPAVDVFGERDELIAIAALRHEKRIAYIRPDPNESTQ